MKADEIMIGDWVQNPLGAKGWARSVRPLPKDSDGLGGYYRIDIAYSNDGDSYTTIEEKDVKPIPLTPEILEKNGFEKREIRALVGTQTVFVFSDDYQDTVVSEYTDSIWEVEHSSTEFSFPHTRNFVGHVHELQHVLKLCGLDIEIKL